MNAGKAYFGKLIHDQRFNLLYLGLFVYLFQFMFGWTFFEADLGPMIDVMIKMVPPVMIRYLGLDTSAGFIGTQMLTFGYSHPLMMTTMSLVAISIPTRYISWEIENKSFDLLLTRPMMRRIIPFNLLVFALFSYAILFTAMVAGTATAWYIFDLPIQMKTYATIAGVGLIFFLSLFAISMALSVFFNERGRAMAVIIAVVVVLYFFDTLLRISTTLEPLKAISYFQLYQPGELAKGNHHPMIQGALSGAIILAGMAVACYKFATRDL